MKKSKNLFIVETPFQLMSAIEAKNYFNATLNDLLIYYSLSVRNNAQIDNLLTLSNWDRIIRVKSIKQPKLSLIRNLFVLKKMQVENDAYDKIFIGEFRNGIFRLFLCTLAHNDQYLLDDGTATIEIQNDYLTGKINYVNESFRYKLILSFFSYKSHCINKINLFTCFDLKPHDDQKIVKNKFSTLRKLASEDVKICSNDVYFLGGDYLEKNYVSENYYLETLKKIRQYYGDNKIIYIPHRGEDEKNILKIMQIDGFAIERFSNIAEVEFVLRNIYPRIIASFCSTALYTLQIIFQNSQIDSFLIPQVELNPIYQRRIEEFYDFYRNTRNINVIDLTSSN